MSFWPEIKYFRPYEFDSPDAPGSGDQIDETLVRLLDRLRGRLGFPLTVTSGVRTRAHNARVGGAPDSVHLIGKAVDIAVTSDARRFKLIRGVLRDIAGVTRIGIYRSHVHIDIAEDRTEDVMWVRLDQSGK